MTSQPPKTRVASKRAEAVTGQDKAQRPGVGAYVLLGLLALYRYGLSPLLGQRCRYQPTCSAYMAEAVRRYGAWAGGWMGLARIVRCHPVSPSGFDPVPEAIPPTARWWTPWRYGFWSGDHIDPATRLDVDG